MSLGIECLIAEAPARALELAGKLDRLNRERRVIEDEMRDSALAMVEEIRADGAYTLAIHRPEWHAGVVGLLASRIKDRLHRPVFAFAADGADGLKGSGRSIAGFHLRDALDLVYKPRPGLLDPFVGQAAAAGRTLCAAGVHGLGDAVQGGGGGALSAGDHCGGRGSRR